MTGFDWQTKRILVIDRDEQFRFWARGVFRTQRVRDVLTLHDPAEGRVLLNHQTVDIGLLGLEQGDVEALTLLRWLRERRVGPCRDLPLLVLVKSMDRDLLNQACTLGIHGVLRKPISAELLLKSVAAAISKPRLVGASLPHAPSGASPPPGGKTAPAAGKPPAAAAHRPGVGGPARLPHQSGGGDGAAVTGPRQGGGAPAGSSPPPAVGGGVVEVVPQTGGRQADGQDFLLVDPPADGNRRPAAIAPQATKAPAHRSAPVEPASPPAVVRAATPAGPDVEAILADHARWVASGGGDGKRARLDRADLAGRDLAAAQLTSALLGSADLSGCNLSEAQMHGADLRHADLTGSRLVGANLAVSRLRHARLCACQLDGANLRGADLAGADLSATRMPDAELHGAILLGANLSAADLSGAAGLTQAQLERVRGDGKTRLPPGLFLPATED